MKTHVSEQLRALEAAVERHATGLDMAANLDSIAHSFDKLLKVCIPQVAVSPHRDGHPQSHPVEHLGTVSEPACVSAL